MKKPFIFDDDFYKESGALVAKSLTTWKKEKQLYNFKTLPNVAVLSTINCFSKKDLFFLKKIKGFNASVYLFNNALLILNIGIGAPSVISLMEELKELGIKKFVFLGYSGRLDNSINSGEIFKTSEAFSLTGTSLFYQKKSFISYKTDLHNGINLDEVKVLSVDAPFRETKNLLNEYKSKNAILVDMETAAILAFGKFYNIPVCSILVAADLLLPEWEVPKNLKKSLPKVKKIIKKLSLQF